MSKVAPRDRRPHALSAVESHFVDVDEARTVGSAMYHAHDLEILGDHRRFALRLAAKRVGALTLGWLSYDTEVRVEAAEPLSAYQVNVPIYGNLRTWSGDDRMVASPRRAAVHQADRRHAFQGWDSSCRVFGLRIERRCLDRQLEVLLGRPVRSPVTFDLSLDVARGPGHHWWAVVQALAAQVHDADSPSPHPLLVASLEHSVTTGLLLAAGHDRRADLDAPVRPACPLAVRRAIDYIESHPELPLTVGDIADVAGVGVRALQEGFRAALDTTPMRYLRDVRLARARQDLLEADGESAGIAEIAYRWGFSHLGRFTAQYRATYREPPSRTLLDR